MNKELFSTRLFFPVLVGVFVAGCTHTTGSTPVRDSRPVPTSRAISQPPVAVVSPVARPGEHVVRRGETLYAVSRLYGVPVQDLIVWNNLSRPEQLEVGQTLRVAAPEVIAVPVAPLEAASPPEIKNEPRGGKEAWSEEAWARLYPQTASNVPAATISTPELSAPPEPGAPPESSASVSWMWPVKGTIISRFDEPTGSDGKVRNRGIDIDGTPGTPVLAAAGGKVVYAGSALRGLGNMVIIKHNDEYLTAYAHNRVILVQEGNTVAKGQKIAELGSSDSDRPKLHFELRKQGTPVDPLKYLPGL
ncbi:MAG: peptidoglycan DD-metalloendopeptidase family protein [Azoarcus sp.]|jgi:lipoprotein NlpD|nr:peptidoglycan DD-metalloendopeptidase family protein [Azoarcus sp.]